MLPVRDLFVLCTVSGPLRAQTGRWLPSCPSFGLQSLGSAPDLRRFIELLAAAVVNADPGRLAGDARLYHLLRSTPADGVFLLTAPTPGHHQRRGAIILSSGLPIRVLFDSAAGNAELVLDQPGQRPAARASSRRTRAATGLFSDALLYWRAGQPNRSDDRTLAGTAATAT